MNSNWESKNAANQKAGAGDKAGDLNEHGNGVGRHGSGSLREGYDVRHRAAALANPLNLRGKLLARHPAADDLLGKAAQINRQLPLLLPLPDVRLADGATGLLAQSFGESLLAPGSVD